MKRALRILLPLVATLVFASGCESQKVVTAKPQTTGPSTPQRIVSLAPSVTETLFALGAGDRVVGVTRFCDYPEEARALPKIGGLTDVNVEIVLSLKPDLVVGVMSKTGSGLERTLKLAKIDALFVPVETFDDVQSSMRELGKRVGAEARGEELAAAIGAIDETPGPEAPSLLLLFGRDPWVAAGPKTFGDEMIRRAGGVNAVADLDTPYPTLDAERFETLTPDIIIDTSWGAGTKTPIPTREGTAVMRLDPALIRPGPRLAQAMALFQRAIQAAQAE